MARKSWWQEGGAAGNMVSAVKREREINEAAQLDLCGNTSTDIVCVLGHSKSSQADSEDSQGCIIEHYIGNSVSWWDGNIESRDLTLPLPCPSLLHTGNRASSSFSYLLRLCGNCLTNCIVHFTQFLLNSLRG